MQVTSWQHKVAYKDKWQEFHNMSFEEETVVVEETLPVVEEKKEEETAVEAEESAEASIEVASDEVSE